MTGGVSQPPPEPLDEPTDQPRLAGTACLVAGIDGFLGAHLAVAAQLSGARVLGIDLPGRAERGERVRASLGSPGLPVLAGDLTSPRDWSRAFRECRPAALLHAAGSTGTGSTSRDRARVRAGNVETTSAMLQALNGLPASERPVVVYPHSRRFPR